MKYLIHYGMFKFYVRHGKVVHKIHEIIFLKKSNGRKNIKFFIHKNEIRLQVILKKVSTNYSILHSTEKQWKMLKTEQRYNFLK